MDEAVQKQKLHYGPVAAFIVSISSFFGSQFLAAALISIVPALFGWDIQKIESWFETSMVPQTLIVTVSAVIILYILRWFLKRRGDSFKGLGLGGVKLSMFWKAALGFLTYIVLYLLVVALAKAFIPALDLEQKQELGFDFSSPSNLPLLMLSLVIVPPLLEEIVMRGFLFSGLRTNFNFIPATIITSFLFALAHLPAGQGGPLWVGAIDTFVLSVVLCYLREKTGSLWPAILVHAMKNGVALTYLLYLG